MQVNVTTKKRRFDLRGLSEFEGKILRTIFNLDRNGLRASLVADDGYWESEGSLLDAINLAEKMRDQIFEAVDGHKL